MSDERLTRRKFGALGLAAGATAIASASALQAQERNGGLQSEFLFAMTADIEPPLDIGARHIYNVTGGTFSGPKMSGEILPGGGDWLRRRPDGVSELDVRATLKTDDGELIYVQYRGIVAPRDGGVYFRTTPVFETGSEKYGWLNNIVSVGVNRPAEQGKVTYDIYEIL